MVSQPLPSPDIVHNKAYTMQKFNMFILFVKV